MRRKLKMDDDGVDVLEEGSKGTAIDVTEEVKEDAQTVAAEGAATNGHAAEPQPKQINPEVFKDPDEKSSGGSGAGAAGPSPGATTGATTEEKASVKVPGSISTMTARQVAEYAANAICLYGPKLIGEKAQVNIQNVMYHQEIGHMPPIAANFFSKINAQCERDLQFTAEEKNFLIEIFIPAAKIIKIEDHPLLVAAGGLFLAIMMKMKQASLQQKANEQMMRDMTKQYLDGLLKAKEGQTQKAPEPPK